MLEIEEGQRFDAYHDGKLSPSRLSVVEVIAVVNILEMNKKYLRMWKKAINDDFKEHLLERFVICMSGPQREWDWNCEEFIFCKIVGDKRTERDPMMFARTSDGKGWYAVNWNYRLDIGGYVRKKMLRTWKECAREMGQTMKWNDKELKYDYFDKTGKKVLT